MCPPTSKNGGSSGPNQRRNADQAWATVGHARAALPPAASQLVPTPPIPSHPPPPTLPPCPPARPRPRHPPAGFDFVFLQIESRAWRPPFQLRIRKPDRMPPTAAAAQRPKVWARPSLGRLAALPCLVSLCRNRAIFSPGPRPTYGPRPPTYGLSPFSGHFKPSGMAPQPLIRPCLADTPCLPLSTCPPRLKPKLGHLLPGTGPPEKTRQTIQSNSNLRRRPLSL